MHTRIPQASWYGSFVADIFMNLFAWDPGFLASLRLFIRPPHPRIYVAFSSTSRLDRAYPRILSPRTSKTRPLSHLNEFHTQAYHANHSASAFHHE